MLTTRGWEGRKGCGIGKEGVDPALREGDWFQTPPVTQTGELHDFFDRYWRCFTLVVHWFRPEHGQSISKDCHLFSFFASVVFFFSLLFTFPWCTIFYILPPFSFFSLLRFSFRNFTLFSSLLLRRSDWLASWDCYFGNPSSPWLMKC